MLTLFSRKQTVEPSYLVVKIIWPMMRVNLGLLDRAAPEKLLHVLKRTRVERGMEAEMRILNDIDAVSVSARATVALGMGHCHRWHLREPRLSSNVEPDTRLRGLGGMTSILALHNESDTEVKLAWDRRMLWTGDKVTLLKPGEVCLVTITQIGQLYLYASAVSVSYQ